MIAELKPQPQTRDPLAGLNSCEHRTVSKDGRIVCRRIVEGDNEVSPKVCFSCPFKAVNCSHLRFSLCQTSPTPITVRYNGRVEIWDDEPPELRFERAACAKKKIPILDARSCAGCPLRQALHAPGKSPALPGRRSNGVGKVVPFRSREVPAAAAG
jgi:hypothetical protein